jgi:hypothetical protein
MWLSTFASPGHGRRQRRSSEIASNAQSHCWSIKASPSSAAILACAQLPLCRRKLLNRRYGAQSFRGDATVRAARARFTFQRSRWQRALFRMCRPRVPAPIRCRHHHPLFGEGHMAPVVGQLGRNLLNHQESCRRQFGRLHLKRRRHCVPEAQRR